MTLRTSTAEEISVSVVRCMKALGRTKHTVPQVHPGVDNTHVPVLFALHQQGAGRITALADLIHSDTSTVSRQISTLVDLGLVQRIPDPKDGRAHLVELTQAGREVICSTKQLRAAWIREVLDDWSDVDGRTLVELLDRLSADVDEHVATYRYGSAAGAPSARPSQPALTAQGA